MKEIRLKSLEICNFKGIREMKVSFEKNTQIRGGNASGKTTLFDAFLWLLFGKDSHGKSDFAIKSLTTDGEIIQQIEHRVKGKLNVNGIEYVLERNLCEKWTRTRGSSTEEFAGNETIFSIHGVPITMKEYKQKVDEIVSEELFRLLTNPSYFASLTWQKRREILINIVGDVDNATVISNNASLSKSKLGEILKNHTVDERKKIIVAAKKKCNNELQLLPARIDEVQRTIAIMDVHAEDRINATIAQLELELSEAEARNTKAAIEAENALKIRQYEIAKQIEDDVLKREHNEKIAAIKENIKNIEHQISSNIRNMQEDIGFKKDLIAGREAIERQQVERMKALSAEYKSMNSTVIETDEICPTCKQQLPPEQLEEIYEDLKNRKAESLKIIDAKGVEANRKLLEIRKEIAIANDRLTDLEEQLEAAKLPDKRLESYKQALSEAWTEVLPLWNRDTDTEYLELLNADSVGVDNSAKVNEIKLNLMNARQGAAELKANAKAIVRVDELRKTLKTTQEEFARLEDELILLENFVVEKVNLIESKINSMFKIAKFKLFETQINGGINECCKILFDGVPYGEGLNNAAEINTGLDIISTLSTHNQINAPVWIDNAEAIVELYKIDTQMIKLIVDGNFKKLEVIHE